MRVFILFMMMTMSLKAFASFELSGELHFLNQFETHPTGQRGINAFQLGALILEGRSSLENNNSVVMRYRTQQEELDGLSVKRAHPGSRLFVQFGTFESISEVTEIGLIGNPVNEWSRQSWGQDQMGFVGYSFADRYGFFADSDWGLSFRKKIGNGEWGLRFVNGNEQGEQEQGYHKDLQLSSLVQVSERLLMAASLIYGSYDDYSQTLAVKERAWILINYSLTDKTQLGLEAFLGKDPANVGTERWAEKADLTAYLGSRASSEGLSVQLQHRISEKWQGFFRFDEVSPARNLDAKQKLQLFSLGGRKSLQTQLSFLWAYEYLKLPQNYFQGARDQGRLVLGIAAVF